MAQTQTGVLPIGQVSDFNGLQRNALTQLGQGMPVSQYGIGAQTTYNKAVGAAQDPTQFYNRGNQFYDSAQQMLGTGNNMLGQASNYLQQGTQPLTADRFNQSMSMFQNPYTQQVVGNTNDEILRQAAVLRSGANSAASQAGAFGGARDAIQRSELDRNALQQVGNTTSQLNYQGFNDAANNALGLYGTESANALNAANTSVSGAGTAYTGAGVSGNLGNQQYTQGNQSLNQLQNLTSLGLQGSQQAQNQFYQRAGSALGAGNQIQSQNQRVLDAINGQTTQPVDWLGQTLNPWIQGGTSSSSGSTNPGLAGAAATAAGGYKAFKGK